MKPVKVSFDELHASIPWKRLASFSPDIIVGVERGGIVLAALAAFRLGAELLTLRASLYDDSRPARALRPVPLVTCGQLCVRKKRVLLVDDVSNTGMTLAAVRSLLLSEGAAEVKTFVYAGKADFSCRPFERCLAFPWGKAPG
jgi:uncharacterized protein